MTFGGLLAGGHHLGMLVLCVHVVHVLGHVCAHVWSCMRVQVLEMGHVWHVYRWSRAMCSMCTGGLGPCVACV